VQRKANKRKIDDTKDKIWDFLLTQSNRITRGHLWPKGAAAAKPTNRFSEHWYLHVSHHTYLLTPWSRVLLEKLTGSASSQEIPHIFGTRRFITVLTSARHLSLSWANSILSSQPPPTSWRSILILSSHLRLGLPNGLFPSGFPTRTLVLRILNSYKIPFTGILCTPLPYVTKHTRVI